MFTKILPFPLKTCQSTLEHFYFIATEKKKKRVGRQKCYLLGKRLQPRFIQCVGQELKGIILACSSFHILWKHCGTANFLPVNQFCSLPCSLCAVPLQSMERDLLPTVICNSMDQREHKPTATAHVSRCNYILPRRKNKRVHQILNAHQENSTNLLDVLSFTG